MHESVELLVEEEGRGQGKAKTPAAQRTRGCKRCIPSARVCIIVGLFGVAACLILMFNVYEESPNMENTVSQILTLGVLEPYAMPGKEIPGVPGHCGNANPLHTLTWMNPRDFNSTTLASKYYLNRLHDPKLDAPAFVVGCGHSGTTELITLLDRHPLIYAYLHGSGMEHAVQPNSFISPSNWIPVRSQREDLWFAKLAAKNHATHWAIKAPSNVCRIGYILKSLPDARIIMMVRDGRDSMVSLRERYPRKDPTGSFVLGRWVHDNTAGLLYENDPRMLIVRLEDLTSKPDYWLPVILHHLGAPATWEELDTAISRYQHSEKHGSNDGANTRRGLRRRRGYTSLNRLNEDLPNEPSKVLSGPLHWYHSLNRSRSLVDTMLVPPPSHHEACAKYSPTVASGELPDGADDHTLRLSHTDLRKCQVSQALHPIIPKWPLYMTPEEKELFKSEHQAVRLMAYFGYTSNSSW